MAAGLCVCYSSFSTSEEEEQDERSANAIFAIILFSRAINATRPRHSVVGALWRRAVQINVIADLQTCSDEAARAFACSIVLVGLVLAGKVEEEGKQNT